jgi:hypothetical protein
VGDHRPAHVVAVDGKTVRGHGGVTAGSRQSRGAERSTGQGAENLVVVCQRARTLLRHEISQRRRNGHRRNAALATTFVLRLLLLFEMRRP